MGWAMIQPPGLRINHMHLIKIGRVTTMGKKYYLVALAPIELISLVMLSPITVP